MLYELVKAYFRVSNTNYCDYMAGWAMVLETGLDMDE
jgi:hypothetical protein